MTGDILLIILAHILKNKINWKRNKNEMKKQRCLVISAVLWSMLHLVNVQDDFHKCMMFMVYKSKMMSATNGSGHAHHSRTTEFIPGVLLCSCCRIFISLLCFVDHCLSFCTLSFWPLCCLFFFYLRILITPLISSHFKTLTSDS